MEMNYPTRPTFKDGVYAGRDNIPGASPRVDINLDDPKELPEIFVNGRDLRTIMIELKQMHEAHGAAIRERDFARAASRKSEKRATEHRNDLEAARRERDQALEACRNERSDRKYHEHSVTLNRITWRMLEALGDVLKDAPMDAKHVCDADNVSLRLLALLDSKRLELIGMQQLDVARCNMVGDLQRQLEEKTLQRDALSVELNNARAELEQSKENVEIVRRKERNLHEQRMRTQHQEYENNVAYLRARIEDLMQNVTLQPRPVVMELKGGTLQFIPKKLKLPRSAFVGNPGPTPTEGFARKRWNACIAEVMRLNPGLEFTQEGSAGESGAGRSTP